MASAAAAEAEAAVGSSRPPGYEPDSDASLNARSTIKKPGAQNRSTAPKSSRSDGKSKRKQPHMTADTPATPAPEPSAMEMVMFYCVPDNGRPFGEQFAGVYATSVALPKEYPDRTSGNDTETDALAQSSNKRGFPKTVSRAGLSGDSLITDQLMGLEAVGVKTKTGTGSNIYRYTHMNARDFGYSTPRHDEQIWMRTEDVLEVVTDDMVQILRRHLSDAVRYADGIGKRVIVYGRGRGASRLMAVSMTLEKDILDNIIFFVLESPTTTLDSSSDPAAGCVASILNAIVPCIGNDKKRDPVDWITDAVAGEGVRRFIILSESDYGGVPEHIQSLHRRLSDKGHIECNMSVQGARYCNVLRAGRADIIPRLHDMAIDIIQGGK